MSEAETETQNENTSNTNQEELLENLKAEADSLGISYTAKATVNSLSKKIQAYRDAKYAITKRPVAEQKRAKSDIEKRQQIQALMKLSRVEITCHDPKIRSRGQIMKAVANSIVNVKKTIPFDTPTHVPQIILNAMAEEKFVMFGTKKLAGGAEVADPKEVKTYSIEYLDPLTPEQLERIAIRQQAEGKVD